MRSCENVGGQQHARVLARCALRPGGRQPFLSLVQVRVQADSHADARVARQHVREEQRARGVVWAVQEHETAAARA